MRDTTPTATPRIRLGFLDGIRGLAALYVLVFHATKVKVERDDLSVSLPMEIFRTIFGYGHFAVAVFIVLSGFSLMLPIARSGVLELDRGFRDYVRRRSRRIMPPYYAALVLSIASLVGAQLFLGQQANDEALSGGSIISHLFLVHNLSSDWVFRINGPMWSVATEWQIYFLLPLVLLPLWRRFGAAVTVSLAWLAPLALHLALPWDQNFSWAAPWFIGSFAAGMWCAIVSHESAKTLTLRWGVLAVAALALLVAMLAIPEEQMSLIYLDFVVTIMTVGLILYSVHQVVSAARGSTLRDIEREPARSSRLTEFLGSPPLLALGAFSYSLYLLQHPLLRFSEAILDRTPLGYEAILWFHVIVIVPIIMVLSRIFAEFFEMPFTGGSPVVDALGKAVRERVPAMAGRSAGRASGGTGSDST